MAFNGSAHFKPGELVGYFESVGARLGPHVNAYTSFDETVYMLDLPSDKPEVVEKGLTALADFAGGLTLSKEEVDKERGVVVEEWRGGLGAGSRIRDKQFPVLFHDSRYAERLPIGKPEIIRTAPVARLRAFYDTWYRPERDGGDRRSATSTQPKIEATVKTLFSPLSDRAPAAPLPDRKVPLHQQPLVSVVADPEVTRSNVQIVRKRPREGESKVADYRRDLIARTIDHMMDERFSELERKPDAKFLGAGVGNGTLSKRRVDLHHGGAGRGRHSSRTASARSPSRRCACASSASAAPNSTARSNGWPPSTSARTTSATRPRADRSRRNTSATSSTTSRARASPTSTSSCKQLLPTITRVRRVDAGALAARTTTAGSSWRPCRRKPGIKVPTEAELQAAIAAATAARVTPWTDTGATRALMEHAPTPGAVASRRVARRARRHRRPLRERRRGVAEADRFQERPDSVLAERARRHRRSRRPADYPRRRWPTAFVSASGAGGLKALDLQKVLAGKLVVGAALYRPVDATACPAARRRRSSKRRCSCSTRRSPHRATTPESFALLQAAARGGGRQPRPRRRSRCSAKSWRR